MYPMCHFWASKRRYTSLRSDEKSDSQENELEPSNGLRRERWLNATIFTILPWVISVVLSMIIMILLSKQRHELGTNETGFRTDFGLSSNFIWLFLLILVVSGLLKKTLRITTVPVYGAFQFSENGNVSLSRNPAEPPYFREPSDEIDKAWDTLNNQRFLGLSRKEVEETTLTLSNEEYGGDVFWAE